MTTQIRRRVRDGFGAPTATMTVIVRRILTSPEVAGLLITATRTSGNTVRVGTDLTRAEADQVVEAELVRQGGTALDTWDFGLDEDDLGDAVRWAVQQIRGIWPGLSDPALSALVAAHAPPLIRTVRSEDPAERG